MNARLPAVRDSAGRDCRRRLALCVLRPPPLGDEAECRVIERVLGPGGVLKGRGQFLAAHCGICQASAAASAGANHVLKAPCLTLEEKGPLGLSSGATAVSRSSSWAPRAACCSRCANGDSSTAGVNRGSSG